MRVARLLVPLTVLALLAGCAGDAADADGAAEPEPAPAADSAEPRRIKVMSADADLYACLQGTWDIPSEAIAADAVSGIGFTGELVDATAEVTGARTLTYGPGTLTMRYEDQTVTITGTFDGEPVALVAGFSGETVHDYSLAGDVLSVSGADLSGVTVESTIYVDGEELSLPEYEAYLAGSMETARMSGYTERVTCSGATLRTTPMVAGTANPDLTLTLTRRS